MNRPVQVANHGYKAFQMKPEQKVVAGFRHVAQSMAAQLERTFGVRLDRTEEFYQYELDNVFINVGALATQTAIITISQEADFVATAFMKRSPTQANEAAADQPFRFRIVDTSTDREMSNTWIHGDFVGDGRYPHFLPKPRIFSRNSTVRIQFNELANQAIRIYFCMTGYKIFDVASLDLTRQQF